MRNAFRPKQFFSWGCLLLLVSASTPSSTIAQTKVATTNSSNARLTARKVSTSNLANAQDRSTQRAIVEGHPLWPALELAVNSYKHIRRNVRDYSCGVVRQERVNGRLLAPEYMTAKVRHQRTRKGEIAIPFSVYLKVLAPAKVKGREVLYVDGKHEGDMFVRNGGKRFAFVTATIKPTSDRAMQGNRYPLTEFGFENLVKRLIEVVKEDIRFDVETNVEYFNNASINGRSCTGIRVTHPHFDSRLRFHAATVFMDTELKVPVHYEAHGWAKEDSQEPPLLEKYTYRDIRLNRGYTDHDFDPSNPNYKVK